MRVPSRKEEKAIAEKIDQKAAAEKLAQAVKDEIAATYAQLKGNKQDITVDATPSQWAEHEEKKLRIQEQMREYEEYCMKANHITPISSIDPNYAPISPVEDVRIFRDPLDHTDYEDAIKSLQKINSRLQESMDFLSINTKEAETKLKRRVTELEQRIGELEHRIRVIEVPEML